MITTDKYTDLDCVKFKEKNNKKFNQKLKKGNGCNDKGKYKKANGIIEKELKRTKPNVRTFNNFFSAENV